MSNVRILVVEDENIVAKDIELCLRRLGYEIAATVASADEAIRMAEWLRPDLVLMDIVLKGRQDGIAAAQAIRDRHRLPVVYLTAHADKATLQRARITEPFGYILKPFEERDLHTSIEMALYKHRMEQRLRESEQWFATTLRSISEGVLATDERGRVKFMNASAAAMTGWPVNEALGRACDEIFHIVDDQTREPVANPLQRALREGIAVSLPPSTLLIASNGVERPINDTAAPILDERGNVAGAVLVFWDISQRVQLEKQLRQAQKLESVGRLAGGIAHDFNNMLTVILGYAEVLLASTGADNPLHEGLQFIRSAGERSAALTNQLLAFSRKQVLIPVVLDLNSVVTNLEKMLAQLIGEDIALTLNLEPELRPVRIDPGQLEQVLFNLVVNARDAMPQGGRLTVQTANGDLTARDLVRFAGAIEGPYSIVSVRDTGAGMDDATRARIFEPFFTTKGVGHGTGLGLATVYGVVVQSGGFIDVESELGGGSQFQIYLPSVSSPPAEALPRVNLSEMPRGDETILLVEDEDVLRNLAQTILESCGYRVLTAGGAEEALALCSKLPEPIALLVTDVIMPHLSGRELAERMAALRPDTKLLYMSGYTDDAVLRYGLEAAKSPFLQKPFTPQALARRVRDILDGQ